MKKIFFLGLLLLLKIASASAADYAGWNGSWIGLGTVMDRANHVNDCGIVGLAFYGSANSIEFPGGLNNCDIFSSFIEPVRFELAGEILKLNGQAVGHAMADKIQVTYRNPEVGVDELLELEIDREKDVLYYRDTITLTQDGDSLTIKAVLQRN